MITYCLFFNIIHLEQIFLFSAHGHITSLPSLLKLLNRLHSTRPYGDYMSNTSCIRVGDTTTSAFQKKRQKCAFHNLLHKINLRFLNWPYTICITGAQQAIHAVHSLFYFKTFEKIWHWKKWSWGQEVMWQEETIKVQDQTTSKLQKSNWYVKNELSWTWSDFRDRGSYESPEKNQVRLY